MTHKPGYMFTPNGISLLVNDTMHTIPSDHANFGKIRDAIKSGDFDSIPALADVRSSVRKWLGTDPDFTLVGDRVMYLGVAYTDAITNKVLAMIDAGHSPDPIFKFLRKVELNPSATARAELLLFCTANGFLIDTEGNIIAYKSVSSTFHDIHSGTVCYKPAALMDVGERAAVNVSGPCGREKNVVVRVVDGQTVVSMPRNAVDDNRDRTCSYGLHFASYEYASSWAGSSGLVLLALAVNPAHVVSIPSDYNNQKGRTAQFSVITEIKNFAKLPHKEVYTREDLDTPWDTDDCDCDGCGDCSDEDFAVDNSEEIARKEAVIAKVETRMAARDIRIAKIEELGGDASELQDENREDADLIDRIEGEIAELS